jgi:Phage integrase family
VVTAVETYLSTRTDVLPWLWVGLTRGRAENRLTAEGVRHICVRLARQVGIPHFSPHQLRHTSATSLLDAGVQESVIANHLGHHGLGTLQNYAEVRPKRRAEALSAMQAALGGQAAPTGPVRVKPPSSKDEFFRQLVTQLVETVERLESRVVELSAAVGIDEQEPRQPFDWESLAPDAS